MKSWLLALGCLGLLGATSAVAAPPPVPPAYTVLKASDFQKTIDGKPVALYVLRNSHGVEVALTNYGARIEQILVPDRHGKLGDIAQGYATIDGVLQGQASMGAFIGRYANRIANGKFSLDGKDYQLAINDLSTGANERHNTLHGGQKGSRFVVFDARQISPSQVVMSYVFKDGEENFPGTLPTRVLYTLDNQNNLTITWEASADDKTTVANFTQHTFFNLSGDLGSAIYDTKLYLNASKVLESDATLVPNGNIVPVAGTVLDFTKTKAIGRDIEQKVPTLIGAGGYDHSFVIDGWQPGKLVLAGRASEPRSGRVLEVWSTEPGVQFYSGNFLEGKAPRDVGKGNVVYKFRSAFCLEASHYPDSVNHPNFPTTTLMPGQWYTGQIVYKFRVEK